MGAVIDGYNGRVAGAVLVQKQGDFLDEVRIQVSSGKGGDGAVHFRKEKYVPRGGPDGGDGGKGGDVVFIVDPKRTTLSAFRGQRHFRAKDGKSGGGNNRSGKHGEDIQIHVPPGTIIRNDKTGALLGDLVEPGQELIIYPGGRGGRGNARFATSRNQTPRMAEKGAPGEKHWIYLELRLIADIGIIGVPNAGKSTLLAAVTNAKPKIAEYPFTTLHPNLGVAELAVDAVLVLADIPGLIEGAHQGVGLGFQFLRHIQRTQVLIHLLDGLSPDPLADFSQINAELAYFDPLLGEKPQLVAINKIDIPEVRERVDELKSRFESEGYKVFSISALARDGLRELLFAAFKELQSIPTPELIEGELPVYQPDIEVRDFEITREPDGSWRISGEAVERAAAMTYWEYDEAISRFQQFLVRVGVEAALQKAGIASGDTVRIGENELEWVI
ncbi:MAG: GTPase ObgE [Anaerolineales bacterium]|nr:GTPase ObgE [Anaerolineales bacterium]